MWISCNDLITDRLKRQLTTVIPDSVTLFLSCCSPISIVGNEPLLIHCTQEALKILQGRGPRAIPYYIG